MGKRTSEKVTSDMFDNAENSQAENTETVTVPAEIVLENETEIMTIPLADEKSYKFSIKKINDALSAAKKSFLKIAFALEWIDTTRAYELDGYENIESLAKERFGIGRTSAYNYIHVARRFGVGRNADTGEITGLNEAYKAYSPTQLIILYDSGATDRQIDDMGITPALTCSEIKNFLKFYGLLGEKTKTSIPDNRTDTGNMDSNGTTDSDGTTDNGSMPASQGSAGRTPDGNATAESPRQARTHNLFTLSSLEDFDKQEAHILDIIKNALSQDGLPCTVTISMTYD